MKLLVSVRGANEAEEAAQGGAHIADVEFPASALGTPYPLNIVAVCERLAEIDQGGVLVSTNIGEEQPVRSTACQAALGVSVAGANLVKCGVAGLDFEEARYLMESIKRTVARWRPEVKVYAALFPEERFSQRLSPLEEGLKVAEGAGIDGILIDTFEKGIGKGLLDYYSLEELTVFCADLQGAGKEAWLAGSVTLEQLPALWRAQPDVICVRGAACANDAASQRFGSVRRELVQELAATIPTG